METKLEQNNSLDQLSTKESSKFREAVTTGQARVEDLPSIDSEVHKNPGSGYVAIIKADGTAEVHGFDAEPRKISINSAQETSEGLHFSQFPSRTLNDFLEGSGMMGALREPPPAEIAYRGFRDKVNNFAFESDRLSAGTIEESARLRSDFCDFVIRDHGAMTWDEIDFESLPSMDVLADRFENHIRSEIENTVADLNWEEQNLVRGLLKEANSISDLDKIYKALKLPYYVMRDI